MDKKNPDIANIQKCQYSARLVVTLILFERNSFGICQEIFPKQRKIYVCAPNSMCSSCKRHASTRAVEVGERASLLLCETPLTTPEQMLLTYTSSCYVSSQLHTAALKMHKLVHCGLFFFLE